MGDLAKGHLKIAPKGIYEIVVSLELTTQIKKLLKKTLMPNQHRWKL